MEYPGFPAFDERFIGGASARRPVRVGRINLPSKGQVISVNVQAKRKSGRSGSRSRSSNGGDVYFPRPFAFIDNGYQLLTASSGHEFIFMFDQYAVQLQFEGLLKGLEITYPDGRKESVTLKNKLTNAFAKSASMNFDGLGGRAFVYEDVHKEGVNGVLFEVKKGAADSLLSVLAGKGDVRKSSLMDVVMPEKGTVKAWVLNPMDRVPSTAGMQRPNPAILRSIIDNTDLNATWRKLVEDKAK